MAELAENPTLPLLQLYMYQVCQERGWTRDNYAEKFMLFTEEVGELAKAIRGATELYEEKAKPNAFNLEEEFADVLSYLLDLANYFHIDLEHAFREKEQINLNRIWEPKKSLAEQEQKG
jgi:NTP pyrophosphatase (non-canonical NTP hydrolase)